MSEYSKASKDDEADYKTAALKIDGADETISEELDAGEADTPEIAERMRLIRSANNASLRSRYDAALKEGHDVTGLNPDLGEPDWLEHPVIFTKTSGVRDSTITRDKCRTLPVRDFTDAMKHIKIADKGSAPGWIAAEYLTNGGACSRGAEHVRAVTLLTLDVDNKGHQRSSLRRIKRWARQLGLAALVLTSHSATEELPKFRVILFLLEPVIIRHGAEDGEATRRTKDYSRGYKFTAETLPGADLVTCDINRFWFDPTHAPGATFVVHEFIPGNKFDWYGVARQIPAEATREYARRPADEPTSEARAMFDHAMNALRGQYTIAEIMRVLYGERGTDKNSGFEHPCPFFDQHESQKDNPQPDERCVISWNPEDAQHGVATSSCVHGTCKVVNKRTAADFLFAALMEHRPEVLGSIRAFGDFMREYVLPSKLKAFDTVLAAWVPDDDEIDAAFDEIEAAEGDQQKALARAFLKRLAVLPEGVDTLTLLERLQPFLGMPLTAAKKALNDERKAIKQARASLSATGRGDSVASGHGVPADPAEATIIYASWDYYDKIACARARFCAVNNKEPAVFRRTEGGIVRLQNVGDAMLFEPVNNRHQWVHELAKRMKFCVDTDDTEADAEEPFVTVLTEFMGANDLPLPVVERIVEVPVFGEDGTLRTEKGYDAASKVYFNPKIEFLPVPDVVTEAHVEEAKALLFEASRDFPFTDDFTGSDLEPVRRKKADGAWADVDADGFPLPNPARGVSSRANFQAMLLQPFARSMIDGSCPAFLLDKQVPGTGAGFLADVAGMILNGARMVPQTIPDNDDEFRKEIAATLREGATTIFFDNMTKKVDSGAFASGLTAGVWKSRILGQSATVSIPIKATWVLAANGGEFSSELMRRIVPIRMDAALANPGVQRGPDWFKYARLHVWLKENRAKLVWACHVLIKNWVQAGKPMGKAHLASFEAWAGVMGGILEQAGIEGFLANHKAYLETGDEEGASPHAGYALALFKRYDTAPFQADEAYVVTQNGFGQFDRTLGLDALDTRSEEAIRKGLEGVTREMHGKVYSTKDGQTVQFKKYRSNGTKMSFAML